MASIRIAHSPLSDAATLSGGSWDATLALANLKTDTLSEVARSTDAATGSTKIVIDFGAATEVSDIVLGPTNVSADATWTVKGSSSDTFASGYDSGTLDPGLSAADIDAVIGTNLAHTPATPQTYRYWEIAISDASNAAGYIEAGRLFVGGALAPSINYGYGRNGMTLEDRTRREETLGGVSKRDPRRNRRVLNFGIDYLPDAEAFGPLYQFERAVGFDKLVFVMPDPSATGAVFQGRSFWGTVSAMDPISQVAFGLFSASFTIREEW